MVRRSRGPYSYKLILAAAFWFGSGVSSAPATGDPPFASANAEVEAARIVDLFYDLHFDQAETAAQQLTARYPDYPAGDFYRSIGYYQRYLLEDPRQESTLKAFFAASEDSLQKAVKLLPRSPATSHFYQGAALGFQARVYVAQKHYAAAIPRARQGAKHLQEALKLDPSLEDANLGLGMYYYFLDRIPPAAKPFAYMMIGMWGDRDKGLTLLREAAEKGRTAQREAQSVLAGIDASEREQKWDEAQVLLTQLMERCPHNPRYRIKLVYVLQREGLWEAAAQTSDPEGSWVMALDPIIRDRVQSFLRYRAAECLLFAGRWQDAVILLDHLESREVPPAILDWVALRRGNALDAQGRSAEAAAFYSTIEENKARALAHAFVESPFPAGPRDVMPNHWPPTSVPE